MPLLGAHQSIAGGYFKAVEIAARVGCDCVQVFTWKLQENRDGTVSSGRFYSSLKPSMMLYETSIQLHPVQFRRPGQRRI